MIVKKIVSLVIIMFVSLSVLIPLGVHSQDSESVYEVKNNLGEVVLTLKMKDGQITIVVRNKAAAPNVKIRWESIGLSITRAPITSKTTYKGYTGTGPVRDAASSGITEIYFDQAASKTTYRQGDDIIATITFSEEQIKNALKDDFSDLKKGTTIYLHGIFRSFNYELRNGQEIKTTRKGNLKNWIDIMSAESWTAGTLSGFNKYFNMQIKFMPKVQGNSIYYVTQDGTFIAPKGKLKSKYIDEYVPWSNEPTSINYYDSNYKLVGFYTTKKLDPTKKWIEEGFLSKGKNINQIKSGQTKVLLGGMEVYLVYQKETNNSEPDNPNEEPKKDNSILNMEGPSSNGLISADKRNNEYFDVSEGIPATESLYANVNTSSYLLGYHFEKKVGTITYPVKVRKEYLLSWTVENDRGEEQVIEKQLVESVVNVKRTYGYWQINNFDLYGLDEAIVYNYALPGERCVFDTNGNKLKIPTVNLKHSSLLNDHIIVPGEISNGITLKTQAIYGYNTKPAIPKEDFAKIANNKIPDLKVKNDSLIINGKPVISDTIKKIEGPEIDLAYLATIKDKGYSLSEESSLLKEGLVVGGTKENGIYHSSGTSKYKRIASIKSKYNENVDYSIPNINSVVVHTPVICNVIVSDDNDQYVQLEKNSSALNLVLDKEKETNDFYLQISNYGFHSNKKGYKERDYNNSLRDEDVSYIAKINGQLRNEVKFPFDIYHYNKAGERVLVNKNTWLTLGEDNHEFSLPIWVSEGRYTASCRSVAVNADMANLDQIGEPYANTKIFNYVASNNVDIEVSGRIYGLTIYDVTDYPIWQDVFRIHNSLELKINEPDVYLDGSKGIDFNKNYRYDYTTGTKDQYGRDTDRKQKYTFPLVDGSHPGHLNQGILKTGYGVRFRLTTVGNMYSEASSILIKPRFYYVDSSGNNREEVNLYYEETIANENRKLVKVGDSLDRINIKFQEAGSPYVGIPRNELKNTSKLLEKDYEEILGKREGLFNFGHIRIPSSFRTFTDLESKYIQNWYGYYYLPSILYATPMNTDVYDYSRKYGVSFHEDFWLDDGYIIVNFDILTVDDSGQVRLGYYNKNNILSNDYNSMWELEGFKSKKISSDGTVFNFEEGDFLLYDINSSMQDDYSSNGLY